MDIDTVRKMGREVLGLELTEAEVQEVIEPLAGLQQLIDDVAKVRLQFTAEPFVSPRLADAWLERWPEP